MSCPASGAPRSFAMARFLGRGRVNNNNNICAFLVVLHNNLNMLISLPRDLIKAKAIAVAALSKILSLSRTFVTSLLSIVLNGAQSVTAVRR